MKDKDQGKTPLNKMHSPEEPSPTPSLQCFKGEDQGKTKRKMN